MMLQTDGSPHDWLEGRGPPLTLVGAIDDATSKVPMAFFEQAETSWAYLRLFDEIFKKEGLPHSLYSDCHSIFGLTGSRHWKNSSGVSGPPQKWDEL